MFGRIIAIALSGICVLANVFMAGTTVGKHRVVQPATRPAVYTLNAIIYTVLGIVWYFDW